MGNSSSKDSAAPWPHLFIMFHPYFGYTASPSAHPGDASRNKKDWKEEKYVPEALLSQAIAERDKLLADLEITRNIAAVEFKQHRKMRDALEKIAAGDREVFTALSLNQITRSSRQDMIAIASLALADGCAEGGNNG